MRNSIKNFALTWCQIILWLIPISGCIPITESQSELSQIVSSNDKLSLSEPQIARAIGRIFLKDRTCVAFRSGPEQITTLKSCIKGSIKLNLATDHDQTNSEEIAFKSGDGKIDLLQIKNSNEQFFTHLQAPQQSEWLEFSTLSEGDVLQYSRSLHDHSLTRSSPCKMLKDKRHSLLAYECESKMGDLGAPLLQNGKVIGIHLGFSAKLGSNIAYDISNPKRPNLNDLNISVEHWNTSISPKKNLVPISLKSKKIDNNNVNTIEKTRFSTLSAQNASCVMTISGQLLGNQLCSSCFSGASDTVDRIAKACAKTCSSGTEIVKSAIAACKN